MGDNSEIIDLEDDSNPEFTLTELPEKSRIIYENTYNMFIKWAQENNCADYSEETLLEYFQELARNYKSSTLWSKYSMLKRLMLTKVNINMYGYRKLLNFVKKCNSDYVPKSTKVFTQEQFENYLEYAPDEEHLAAKVILIFGVYGACRCEELRSICVDDINDLGRVVFVSLKDLKTKMSRSFTISGEKYCNIYRKFASLRPTCMETDRFFIRYHQGTCTRCVMGIHTIGTVPQKVAKFLNLPNPEDYTGHCFRRTSAEFLSLKRYGGWKLSLPEPPSTEKTEANYNPILDNEALDSIVSNELVDPPISSTQPIFGVHQPVASMHQTSSPITSVQLGITNSESDVTMNQEEEEDLFNDGCINMNSDQLIELVKGYPFLYDVGHKEYGDYQKKEVVWKYIGSQLGSNEFDCKRAWALLRDAFRRAMKRHKETSAPLKKWKYEDEMSFLVPHLKERSGGKYSPQVNDHGYPGPSGAPLNDNSNSPPQGNNEILSPQNPHELLDSSVRNSTELTNKRRRLDDQSLSGQNDELQQFFNGMLLTVRKFPPRDQAIAKAKVFKIISDLEIEILSRPQNHHNHSNEQTIQLKNLTDLIYDPSSSYNTEVKTEYNSNYELSAQNFCQVEMKQNQMNPS